MPCSYGKVRFDSLFGQSTCHGSPTSHSYGFKNVVTAADLIHADPAIFPFDASHILSHDDTYEPLPRPLWNSKQDGKPLRFDAVFVVNDPRDWAAETQVITDILLADNGIFGKPRRAQNSGATPSNYPLLFYSNPDLVWATSYHNARLGQGAFHAALGGVLARLGTFPAENIHCIGKPHARTYMYASRVLAAQTQDSSLEKTKRLERVYMIGDNCESDIRGANEFKDPDGTQWRSILVRTGVWKEENGPPTHEPAFIAKDVNDAVDWALRQEIATQCA